MLSCLQEAPPSYITDLKNVYADGLSAIITDDPKLYQQIHGFLQAEQPEDLSKLQFYEEQLLPLSKLYSTDIAVERALKEYVWLKNGAYLVIQPTEALTVVDVNSGKYSAKTKKKKCGNVFKDQSGSGKGNSTADPPAQYFRNYPD